MAWGNQNNVDYVAQNIETVGNGTLTVNGRATARGGLDVGEVNNELQLTSFANIARIERRGAGTALYINADADLESGDVLISHPDGATVSTVIVQSPRLRVGPGDDSGNIDANGVPLFGQALMIGTRDTTKRIQIGNTLIDGFLVLLVGPVQVGGAAGNAGRIDAQLDGAATRNLAIGSQDSTADVTLGRQGQTVNLNTQLNANGNAILLDAAGDLRIVANAQGHGWGASGDFVVAGNVVGWFDAAGIHIQPPVQ